MIQYEPMHDLKINVGHHDCHLFWGQMKDHTDSKYDVHTSNSLQGKITGPWNIGHSELHLFWG